MDKKWTKEAVLEIYNKPLMELLYEAATVHRKKITTRWKYRLVLCFLSRRVVALRIADTVRRLLDITQISRLTT